MLKDDTRLPLIGGGRVDFHIIKMGIDMFGKYRRSVSIGAIALGLTGLVSSVAYTATGHDKAANAAQHSVMQSVGSSLGEMAESFLDRILHTGGGSEAHESDRVIVMGYNTDDDPLQFWRLTEIRKETDGKSSGVLVTEKGKRHPVSIYPSNGMTVIDYRPGHGDDPGFGRFFFRTAEKGNRRAVGRGVVFDCACKDGSITANAAVIGVPAMLLTSAELSTDDKKRLLSVGVQTVVPEVSLDELGKSRD